MSIFNNVIINIERMKKMIFSMALLACLIGCKPATESVEVEPAVQAPQKSVSAVENLKFYPAAAEGMTRYVILLDSLGSDAEYEYQIELIPGKMLEVDACNKHGLLGELVEKTVEGFGYNYYEFNSTGDVFSTQMACLNNEKVHKFISAQTAKIRYNSLLPVVVYAPEGFELKYKIWEAGELKDAQND